MKIGRVRREAGTLLAIGLLALPLALAGASAAEDEKRADPADFGLRPAAREVVGQRTEQTKRFRLSGKGRFAEVATGRQLHYRDPAGKWRASDPSFDADGLDRIADRLPFSVRATRDGLAIAERDGSSGIVFLTQGRPSLGGNTITTIVPGQSLIWKWKLTPSELKLVSNPIARPRGPVDYGFPYDVFGPFAALWADDNGSLTNGSFTLGRPIVLGADGEGYDGPAAWDLSAAESALVLRVDDTALPSSAYPYQIDPPLTRPAAQAANFTAAPFNGGTVAWDDPQRALTNNNAKAKAADLAPAPSAEVTQGLYVHDFGFGLDLLAKVVGIEVTLDRSVGGCGTCTVPADCVSEDKFYLSKDGLTVVGANQAGSTCWPASSTELMSFGGEEDTWAASFTAAEINDSDFGPIVSARGIAAHGGNHPDAEVDFVERSQSTGNSPICRPGRSTRPTTRSFATRCPTTPRAMRRSPASTRRATTASFCVSIPRRSRTRSPSWVGEGSMRRGSISSSSSTPRTGCRDRASTSTG